MAFDWTEYLTLARFIRKHEKRCAELNTEAAHRCTTSRAYYAAFCYARNYARDHLNFQPTCGPDDHRLVLDHFDTGQKTDISDALVELRRWRNQCDYWDVVTDNLSCMSASALVEAKYIIDNLQVT